VVEPVRLVLVTVVGPQVEIDDDLHLLGKQVENVRLEQRVAGLNHRLEVELGAEMIENVGATG
jgi:hypothetical protein